MLGLLVSTVLLAAARGGDAEYETPTVRPLSVVLPPAWPRARSTRSRDPVVADGYMYHYQLDSSFGPFDVTGTGDLASSCTSSGPSAS